MDPRVELLDVLTGRLEILVSTLGGEEAPSAEALESAWSQAAEAFERFRVVADGFGQQALPAEVRRRMEAAMKLDAVAAGLASRHHDGLSLELDKMAGARSHLRSLTAGRRIGDAGTSCDVTG